MANYASVVVESDLLQLDREFDFLVPANLSETVKIGQRVKFQLGRTKKLATGFISALPAESSFATSELVEIVDETPVVTAEIFGLARQVANRQAVALGEILQQAVVEHMPRIMKSEVQGSPQGVISLPQIPGITALAERSAVLTSARSITFESLRYPDWCWLFLKAANDALVQGKYTLRGIRSLRICLYFSTRSGTFPSSICRKTDDRSLPRFPWLCRKNQLRYFQSG